MVQSVPGKVDKPKVMTRDYDNRSRMPSSLPRHCTILFPTSSLTTGFIPSLLYLSLSLPSSPSLRSLYLTSSTVALPPLPHRPRGSVHILGPHLSLLRRLDRAMRLLSTAPARSCTVFCFIHITRPVMCARVLSHVQVYVFLFRNRTIRKAGESLTILFRASSRRKQDVPFLLRTRNPATIDFILYYFSLK